MARDEPELAPLELLPVEGVPADREVLPRSARVIIERELPRSVRWLVSLDIGHRPDQLGTEFTVRRRVHADMEDALPAVLASAPEVHARDGHAASSRRRSRARLVLQLDAARREGGLLRVPARLHGAWMPRAVPVEVDLEVWSTGQSELRLQSRRRHGRARPSQHWFDAAHDVLDALRAAVEGEIVRSSPT